MKKDCDAVVVGAGPCGVAASVQLKRSGAGVLLFERRSVGGLLRNAHKVENYPGFPRGIGGERFCTLLSEHLAGAGVEPVREEIMAAEQIAGGYAVVDSSGTTVTCRVLIVATGTRPRTVAPEDEPTLVGRRIFHEVADMPHAVDGALVLVKGGGDAAFDYALNLAGRGAQVTIARRGEPRCLPLLLRRVRDCGAIEERAGAETVAVAPDADGLAVTIRERGATSVVFTNFLLVACGRIPEDALLRRVAPDWKIGTRLPEGLYAGGDLVRGLHRQAAIAVGDGLAAAMTAAEFMRERSDSKWK